ncbi:DUF342 domain-containing protein [Butyrivibrio sp. VCB2006]|uniref:DUF342 domain-containing protein n=1 Tax=Butyrivibrio sp. VCB2006 TaxID=1280679 RepID=UPI0003FA3434|nr:FapA family protein [Butyrivibrio sp. VCB2006]
MGVQEIELVNELNVYTGLDSLSENALEKELELCKKLGANSEKLRSFGFNALQLAEIRKGLEDQKVDVNKYLNPKLSWTDMEEMRLEMSQGIDMSQYRAQGFDNQQLYQIRAGLAEGIDVSVYAKKVYLADQMREIRHGLSKKNGVPIIFYQDPAFDSLQMREIRKGLQAGIDISPYAMLDIPHMKMRAARHSAQDGFAFTEGDIRKYTAGILEQMHQAFLDKIDIEGYVKRKFDAEQLEQIRLALKENIPIDKYITFDMRGDAIREVRLGLEEGIDVGKYADASYGWQQMYEMRIGLEHQIDISPYCKPLYQADQMRQIRLGIEEGLDVTKFSSLMYTARDMYRIRNKMLSGELQSASNEEAMEGSVLDRTGGVSDQAVLLSSMLENSEQYISISENKMKCWIMLPLRKDGISYTEDAILTFLFKLKIRSGIDRALIKKALANPEPNFKYLIAQGKEVQNGEDGYFEYFFNTESDNEIKVDEDGTIDFSNIESIQQVKVGDKIAVYHKATKGVDGYNIYGEIVKAQNGKEVPILKGEGLMIMSDRVTYVAKQNGAISIDDGNINIKKILIVPEVKITNNVINYDGVVYVKGDVNSGSEIHATGDIIIGGHMESSIVESQCNVIIAGGATCPAKGSITAKGNITAKFFDGVTITGKDISSNYFINCIIEARGRIKTYGRQGVIYGGTAYSLEGVESAEFGNKTGARTTIKLGANSELLAEYNSIQKQISREGEDLKNLIKERDKLQELGSGNAQVMQLKIKINAAIAIKQQSMKNLVAKRQKLDGDVEKGGKATAVVTSQIFAGTIIIIEGVALRITEDRKTTDKIVFRIDAKKEKIYVF